MTLAEKLKDWHDLKRLFNEVKEARFDLPKQHTLIYRYNKLYTDYFAKYGEKMNPLEKPKR